MQGCYLFHDARMKEWVRGVKAVRSNAGSFRVRLDDHKKESAIKITKIGKAIFACRARGDNQG